MPKAKPERISQTDLERLENHLRRRFGCTSLALKTSRHRGAAVELTIGGETVGTVDQVDDEGERSWVVTVIVLAEDLDS